MNFFIADIFNRIRHMAAGTIHALCGGFNEDREFAMHALIGG